MCDLGSFISDKRICAVTDSGETDTLGGGWGARRLDMHVTRATHEKGADGFVRRRLGMRKYGSAFVWVEGPSEMHHPREPLA